MKKLKNFGWGYILIGLLIAAAGVLFISFKNSIEILAIVMGIILALFGILFGVLTLAKRERGVMFALKIALAIICLVCGIVTAIVRGGAISVISSIFCLLLIVDGSFKLQTSILSKRYSVAMWWIMLALSVLIIVSAFLIARLVPADNEMLAVWIGIVMCVDALANILSALFTHINGGRMADELLATAGDDYEEGKDETAA